MSKFKRGDFVKIKGSDRLWVLGDRSGIGQSFSGHAKDGDAVIERRILISEIISHGIQSNADNVNHPHHYQSSSGIECIDAIRAALTPEEFRGYCKGNMIKYVWRERHKGGDESLAKAGWYNAEAQKNAS